MPAAIPVIIAAAVKVGTAVAVAYKASALFRLGVTIAMMLASTMISKALNKRNTPKAEGRIDQGAEIKLKIDPTMPRQVIVGRAATGGSLVWAFTYTDRDDEPNRYLVRIIALSDYPVEGMVSIRAGDQPITFDGDGILSGMVPSFQYIAPDGEPCLHLQFFPGSFTPSPNAWLIDASDGAWTEDHLGVGQAYVVVRYTYDADAFPNGEPQLTFVVDGARCYDDRLDSANPGGSGSHTPSDPNSWSFTENTAVITAQLLRGFYINGKLLIGAGADDRDLDYGNLVAAYNTCDQLSGVLGEDGEPTYRAGMLLTTSESVESMLTDLSAAFDGNIYDRAGRITLSPGGTRIPVMSLTDDDLVWTSEKSWQPKAQISDLFNYVTGTYVSSADGYIEKPFPPRYNGDWQEDDGGQRLTKGISLRAVTRASQAQRISARIHKYSRYQGVITIQLPFYACELEQGDWFTLTSSRWEMSAKYFEVAHIGLTEDFQVAIVGQEVSPDIDVWNPVVEEIPDSADYYSAPTFGLVVPQLSVTPEQVVNEDSTYDVPAIRITTLNVSPNGPASSLDFQMGYFIGPVLTNVRDLASRSATEQSFLIIDGIIPGLNYAVRARSTNGEAYSAWSSYYTVLSPHGYTVPNAHAVGGYTAAEWVDMIEEGSEAGQAALVAALEAISQNAFNAEGILSLVMRHVEDREYQESLTYLEGVPVGTVIQRVDSERLEGDTAIAETIELIGAKSGDGLAFIINTLTAKVSPSESLATRLEAINSTMSGNSAAIASEVTARTTADSAFASNFALMGAKSLDNTAWILDTSTVRVGPSESMATRLSALTAADGTNTAAIATEVTARANGDSSLASSISTLTGTVNGQSASITTLQTVTNGIAARWSVSLNSNGHIAGIILNNGGASSSFTIVADSLIFVDPSGGSPQIPFYISGGVVYADNLNVRLLRANTIVTTHMNNNVVTKPGFVVSGNAYGVGYGSSFAVASAYVTLDVDGWIYADAAFNMNFTAGNQAWNWAVYIAGGQYNGGGGTVFQSNAGGPAAAYLSAGTHQVVLWWSGHSSIEIQAPSLFTMGIMR